MRKLPEKLIMIISEETDSAHMDHSGGMKLPISRTQNTVSLKEAML